MLHQTGVFGVKQFAGVIGIYIRPTPVAMGTKIFNGKIQEIEPQCCTKQGVFQVRQFSSVLDIYVRPTPVAMVTKI